MKKFVCFVMFLTLALSLAAQEVKVEIRLMEKGVTGNQRFPVVCENFLGERLYTFRGSDSHAHYYFYKNGKWSGGGRIPGSPAFDNYWFSDIVADSKGTFHYVVEEADRSMYYAYFKNGAWAAMRLIDVKHEATLSLGVRSDDTIVLVAPRVGRTSKGALTKDVLVGTKPPDKTMFSGFVNVTNDPESSTMVDVAIDSEDNTWIIYKGVWIQAGVETMQATLLVLDKTGKELFWKNVSDQGFVYCWYPRIAFNGDGKVMVTWCTSQLRSYFSRLYDPATKKWSAVREIIPNPRNPWPTMYNKVMGRDSDFYWVGVTADRYVVLYKYHEDSNTWTKLADISEDPALWVSAAMGNESILISYDTRKEPMSSYLAEVKAGFTPIIRIQSVSNLVVEKKVERSFFHQYFMNILTWEANPLNEEQGITIASQRIYRRPRTGDSTQWTQIAEVAGNVYDYLDRDVTADSDYVYAVTCVDTNGAESPIVEPEAATMGSALHGPRVVSPRVDR